MRKSATEVRREGWLYRESGYVNGLVNPRYGAIYPHALVTFRCVGGSVPYGLRWLEYGAAVSLGACCGILHARICGDA